MGIRVSSLLLEYLPGVLRRRLPISEFLVGFVQLLPISELKLETTVQIG